MLHPFAPYNDRKSYVDQIKPFNFLLSAHVAPFGHPDGADPTRFHLVAPFNKEPRQWLKMKWTDLYSGARYHISTSSDSGGPGLARVKTYRDVLGEYRTHPEAKYTWPEWPCVHSADPGIAPTSPCLDPSASHYLHRQGGGSAGRRPGCDRARRGRGAGRVCRSAAGPAAYICDPDPAPDSEVTTGECGRDERAGGGGDSKRTCA